MASEIVQTPALQGSVERDNIFEPHINVGGGRPYSGWSIYFNTVPGPGLSVPSIGLFTSLATLARSIPTSSGAEDSKPETNNVLSYGISLANCLIAVSIGAGLAGIVTGIVVGMREKDGNE